MPYNESSAINLNDYFDQETVEATSVVISANLARARHADFDDTINSYAEKFTPEHHAKALSGRVDPAEYIYQTAREGMEFKETPLEDILEGRAKSHEPSLADELLEET